MTNDIYDEDGEGIFPVGLKRFVKGFFAFLVIALLLAFVVVSAVWELAFLFS